jgi:hypothetical protein
MRWRGKKVVNAVSGKSTTCAPREEAERRRASIRAMTSGRLEVRCTGPIWAAAILRVRGMIAGMDETQSQLGEMTQSKTTQYRSSILKDLSFYS